jgi:predicted ATPase
MFDFKEICDSTFGASDYIAICKNYKTIILKNIPVITTENKSVARRFILLVKNYYFFIFKI